MSDLNSIEELLQRRTGVIVETLGPKAIERAIADRCKDLAITETSTYCRMVLENSTELNHLIDAIIIPESWFFRDETPFRLLAQFITRQTPSPEKPFRALSAPCAAGEEPYSIAMTLLDAGWNPGSFHIDAIDISHELIAKAGNTPFGPLSFRGTDLGFRTRYFDLLNTGDYQLKPALQETVRFRQANLTDPYLLQNEPPYDVIFCRNVLIYLDDTARRQVIRRLGTLLSPEGILLVGHAEGSALSSESFVQIPEPGAFAYRKTQPATAPTAQRKKDRGRQSVVSFRTRSTEPLSPRVLVPKRSTLSSDIPPSPTPIQTTVTLLQEAERRANAGQTREAAKLCQEHLDRHGPSAKAYFLLGTIQMDSDAKKTAAENLQRAVYLEPTHVEALTLLALLARTSGDRLSEDRYRRQLERARELSATLS